MTPQQLKKRTGLIVLAMAVVGSMVLFRTSSFGTVASRAKTDKQSPLVTVATARATDLPIKFVAQGHLVSLNQVDVRPQITAAIRGVHFHEGDAVTAGQLLFSLDATDADAQLRRALAQAAQVQAQLDDARRELARSRELLKEEFVSPSAVDTAASKVETLQAQLNAANADVAATRVTLSHTRIVSPISAQAGAVSVHPGSLAQVSASAPLVTLMQFDPIGVEFNLPESDLAQLLAARALGPVKVTLDSSLGPGTEGTLSFINNTVSPEAGSIRAKASFPNRTKTLWPGTFSRLTISAGLDQGAIVLPPQAILEGPAGRFVYLLDAESKVVAKPVTLLRIQDRLAVVSGLDNGQKVVLDGNQNLRAGMNVRVSESSETSDSSGIKR